MITLGVIAATVTGCVGSSTTSNQVNRLPHTFQITEQQAESLGLPPVAFSLQYDDINEDKSLLPDRSGYNYADIVMDNSDGKFMEELSIGYLDGTAGPVPDSYLQELTDEFKTQLQDGYSDIEIVHAGKVTFFGEERYSVQAKITITDEAEGDLGTYLLMVILYPNPAGGNGVTFIAQSDVTTSGIQSFTDFDDPTKGEIGKMISTFSFNN